MLHCFQPFHFCFSVVLWPEEVDFPENVHRVVCFIINKRSSESFMCLDPIFILFYFLVGE